MFLTRLEKTIILNLKGRVSKILNVSSRIKKEERLHLENVYYAIDSLLLSLEKDTTRTKASFQELLLEVIPSLEKSSKRYIKEHVVPLMSKIGTDEWGKINE